MTEITAKLNNYRQSPRKVRVVARTISGKSVKEAKTRLDFVVKRAAGPLHKLLNSAIANAKVSGKNAESLWVKSMRVDGGKILHRRRPVSRGSAHPIHKRTSNIILVLEERAEIKNSGKKTKK